ncbi:MAG: DUF447 family protein [Methylobacteriaceae bacterium]|nr:DUF447 family protein [Methylobacteriaceae bacterium]MBV9247085.1 DUF447 family protein [Methylobacteriaceae bacterium]
MPMIRETIVTTADSRGEVHIAPLGIIADGEGWIIAPFHPSMTLDNLRAVPFAIANHTDDVRIFAGCLTGRRDWPTTPCRESSVPRLAHALAYQVLAVTHVREDELRPRFHCRVVHQASLVPFAGFNRAQAAVIEAAILVSRLSMLPREKVEREIDYLGIAVSKTAGPAEETAWGWLMERVRGYYAGLDTPPPGETGG